LSTSAAESRRYMVARVESDFAADIMGLQVLEQGVDARVVIVTGRSIRSPRRS
jgi:fructose-specific component phosphotransferase system IIB-like protein